MKLIKAIKRGPVSSALGVGLLTLRWPETNPVGIVESVQTTQPSSSPLCGERRAVHNLVPGDEFAITFTPATIGIPNSENAI